MVNEYLISVMICTYNRCDRLDLALEGLTKQSYGLNKFEVIVIDNNSTDDTKKVVKKYQDILNLRYQFETTQGSGYVRDLGFRMAKGVYVAFIDDDAIPVPGWLFHIEKNILEHEPDCICGPYTPYYTSEKPDWFKDKYEIRALGNTRHVVPRGTTHGGSNMTWKRSILFDVGGFNANLGVRGDKFIAGEDTDLFQRYWRNVNGKIIYDPEVEILHWVPAYKMRVGYVLKRYLAVGILVAKLKRGENFLRKITRALRLIFEITAGLILFPFMVIRHKALQNWVIEEGRRVVVRVGELITMLGFEPRVGQY
jgi:glycosyltransferase involved in cell wall biosynthesis